MFDFVFQGVTRRSHAQEVQALLALEGLRSGIISIAFANESGVSSIESALRPVRTRVDAFVGIRNDITSAQGLKRLRALVNRLFIVDTGTRSRIFHPKIFLTRSRDVAYVVVGSANLTTGGLWNNIEASLKLNLDLRDAGDRAAVDALIAQFEALPRDHPENVVAIATDAAIDELLEAGRVVDEAAERPPRPSARGTNPGADQIPRMRLPLPPRRRAATAPSVSIRRRTRGEGRGVAGVTAAINLRTGYEQVWESNGLTRRDLNIPVGPNTAPTGSMLFKRGNVENIDQRHYFRDAVFVDLDWQPDPRASRQHLERAQATFRLIIKNIDYGQFELQLTHDSRTDSRAYEQRNSLTQIHWGLIADHVRHEDLLGRTLFLYRDRVRRDHFIIEID